VVNVYENSSLQSASLLSPPRPLKAIMNLTTAVDNVVFNPDSQVLAMSSRFGRDALKLVRHADLLEKIRCGTG